jgi:hypothetical protein
VGRRSAARWEHALPVRFYCAAAFCEAREQRPRREQPARHAAAVWSARVQSGGTASRRRAQPRPRLRRRRGERASVSQLQPCSHRARTGRAGGCAADAPFAVRAGRHVARSRVERRGIPYRALRPGVRHERRCDAWRYPQRPKMPCGVTHAAVECAVAAGRPPERDLVPTKLVPPVRGRWRTMRRASLPLLLLALVAAASAFKQGCVLRPFWPVCRPHRPAEARTAPLARGAPCSRRGNIRARACARPELRCAARFRARLMRALDMRARPPPRSDAPAAAPTAATSTAG